MISIIIPVYNTPEKYLKRCIRSIFRQSYKDFEALFIDDGSSKECSELLNRLMPDKRFHVIHQKNTGVSEARNNGLKIAKGQFITFVDSDDYISPDFLSSAIELSEKHNADLVIGGIVMKDGKSSNKCTIDSETELIYTNKSAIQRYFLTAQYENDTSELKGLRCGGPWCKLYRTSSLKDVYFHKNVPIYEDMIFNLEALENTSTIVVSPDIWYHYILYPSSAMRKFRPDGIKEQFKVIDFLAEYKKMYPEISSATAKKTGECIKKIITATLYHKDSDVSGKLKKLKSVFSDRRVKKLLSELNPSLYPALPVKERLFYNLCRKRQVFILHCMFSLK